jgi:Flp pilus assembly protein TadD
MRAAREYEALVARGLDAMRAGRLDEAEAALGRVVALNPKEHRAWHLLAVIALKLGRGNEGIERAQRAVAGERRNPSYLNTLGAALADAGRLEDAMRRFREAIRARPGGAEGHYNLGKALAQAGDAAGARDEYRRALALDPQHPGVHNNLALVLRQSGDADAAIAVLEDARRVSPQDEDLLSHLLIAYRERFGAHEAVVRGRAMLEAVPHSRVLRAVLGRASLAAGDWRAGWSEYLWRDTGGHDRPIPHWNSLPSDLRGRTVRVVGEQGLGDVLLFVRFTPELKARGARVVLECPPALAPLARRYMVFSAIVPLGEARSVSDDTEIAVLAGDLPALLGVEAVMPALPLEPDPQRSAAWRDRLRAAGPPPYVGVTWRAGVDLRSGRDAHGAAEFLYKEIDLGGIAAALRDLSGTRVVLQRAPHEGEVAKFRSLVGRDTIDCTEINADLDDMAALLSVLDDYVGASNTNMHVTASVGKTARVLVPRPAEWRWMEEGDESPWFPGFRIYRQAATRSWDEALARLREDLMRAHAAVI